MRVNDGHTLVFAITSDGNVEASGVCPHQGIEATEDMKCTSADIGTVVDDCAVVDAIRDVGGSLTTDGEDFEVRTYPVPVEFTYEDDELSVVPVL